MSSSWCSKELNGRKKAVADTQQRDPYHANHGRAELPLGYESTFRIRLFWNNPENAFAVVNVSRTRGSAIPTTQTMVGPSCRSATNPPFVFDYSGIIQRTRLAMWMF